jgi:hypothetical protein
MKENLTERTNRNILDIDMEPVRAALASNHWREKLAVEDTRAVGRVLAALSQLMLPYWEARYRHDETMGCLVQQMQRWAASPSPETQLGVADKLRSMSFVRHPDGYYHLSMVSSDFPEPPIKYRYPGDRAGDTIYHIAEYISLQRTSDYFGEGEEADAAIGYSEKDWSDANRFDISRLLESGVEVVAQVLGHRDPDDETTNFLRIAKHKMKSDLVVLMERWL